MNFLYAGTTGRKRTALLLAFSLILSLTAMPIEVSAAGAVQIMPTAIAASVNRSGFDSVAPYEARRAADGNITDPSSRWYTNADEKWLQYTLPYSYSITGWNVYGMGAAGWSTDRNLSDYQLQTSMDGIHWIPVDAVSGNTANFTQKTLPGTSPARLVRLYIIKGNSENNSWASVEEFQVFGVQAAAVTGRSLSIPAPALHATPVNAIPETAEYTGSVAWSPEIRSTFALGIAYTATITLTAKPGYTFFGVPENAFTVNGIQASNAVWSGTLTVSFPALEDIHYNVAFEANGGSGSMDNQAMRYSVPAALAKNGFERNGFTFKGWNTDAAGNGTGYSDQQTVSGLTQTQNAVITLYAVWEENQNISIVYSAGAGGRVSRSWESAAPYSGTVTGSEAFADAGYHFVNWTDNQGGGIVGTTQVFLPNRVNGLNAGGSYRANFAENDPVTIAYRASVGGKVSKETESVRPATGNPSGATASADSGYHFVHWTDLSGREVGIAETLIPDKTGGIYAEETYTAGFIQNNAVMILYQATEGGTVNRTREELLPATGVAIGSEAMAKNGYHFVKWINSENETVSDSLSFIPEKKNGVNEGESYTAVFAENDMVTLTYIAGEGGNVSRGTELLLPVTGKAGGAVAEAGTGYRFQNWKDAQGNTVSLNPNWIPQKENGAYKAAVYTATFQKLIYALESEPRELDFGTLRTGYGTVPAKTVTVRNQGNDTETLSEPTGGSAVFTVGTLSNATLAPGEAASFTVQPKLALSQGSYDSEIRVRSLKGTEVGIPVRLQVGYTEVTDITGSTEAVTIGASVYLTGTVLPENADEKEIVWSVKDPGTTGAVVENGRFRAEREGSAVLLAVVKNGLKHGNFVKEIPIRVTGYLRLNDLTEEDTLRAGSMALYDAASASDATASDALELVYCDLEIAGQEATASDAFVEKRQVFRAGTPLEILSRTIRGILYKIWTVFFIDDAQPNGTTFVYLRHNPVFTVFLDSAGGSSTKSFVYTDDEGVLPELPLPERSGYTFQGWYDASSGGNRVLQGQKTDRSLTLYAVWTQDRVNIPVITGSGSDSGNDNGSYLDPVKGSISAKTGIITGTGPNSSRWQKDEKGWKLIYPSGKNPAQTWEKIDSVWYHFGTNGYAETGWIQDQGKWYHLDEKNNAMSTGWLNSTSDGKWYYLNTDGSMAIGYVIINGKTYYLNPESPVSNTYDYDPVTGTYRYNGSRQRPYGALFRNETTPDGRYADENGEVR